LEVRDTKKDLQEKQVDTLAWNLSLNCSYHFHVTGSKKGRKRGTERD
jgi:hypothetical protein